MSKYEIGQEIPVGGIIKITGACQNKQGTWIYNTDRDASVPEFFIERLEMKPLEKAQPEQPKQEDKPKFKVGDSVKFVKQTYGTGFKERYVGKHGTITHVFTTGHYGKLPAYGTDFTNPYVAYEDELEPYTEPESTEPKQEPEKAEPEYLDMRVVCIGTGNAFGITLGKVYNVENGKCIDDDGVEIPTAFTPFESLEDMNYKAGKHSGAQFAEFKGE